MKTYTKPEIKIVILNNEDVIAVSGGVVIDNFNKNTTKSYTAISY